MESLVGLRAEVQRKREEQQAAASAVHLTGRKLKLKSGGSDATAAPADTGPQNKGVADRAARDKEQQEQEQLTEERARSVLERKAALYERLHGGVAVLEDDNLNNSFLVNFQKKIVDTVLDKKKKRAEIKDDLKKKKKKRWDEPGEPSGQGGDEDWVEHVDALGRTRRVRRSELPALREQDRYLKDEDEDQPAPLSELSSAVDGNTDDASVTALQEQFDEQYRDQQRARWQQQEDINAAKEDVYYQDVMFDEARTHGVGFVRLSSDTESRKQQQQLLRELHDTSEAAAAQHKAQQRVKERGMAQRLAKIRQRKRLKRGLPMTGFDDRLKTPPPSSDEEGAVDEKSAAVPMLVPDPSIRKLTVGQRDWDVGKEVIGKFVEPADKDPDAFSRRNLLGGSVDTSQELWLDKQRKDRNQQFAPPPAYDGGGGAGSGAAAFFAAGGNKRGFSKGGGSRASSSCSRYDEEEDKLQKEFNRKNKCGDVSSTDIVNECKDDGAAADGSYSCRTGKSYESSSVFNDYSKHESYDDTRGRGTEVPPPTSFEYYGPSSKKGPRSRLFEPDKKMDDAIIKGLKRLREQK